MANNNLILRMGQHLLDPTGWDCPPLSELTDGERRKRLLRNLGSVQLLPEEIGAWEELVFHVFGGNQEWALRYAVGFLISAWAARSAETPGVVRRFISEHTLSSIQRRARKRLEYENMFMSCGDVVARIMSQGDVGGARVLLGEVTEYAKDLPEAERLMLVETASKSDFWEVVSFLAGKGDPQAARWMEAMEGMSDRPARGKD